MEKLESTATFWSLSGSIDFKLKPMSNMRPRLASIAALSVCLGLVAIRSATGADPLVWRATEGKVDARIDNWSLGQLLRNISVATGWEIYVEPDTDVRVSVKFANLEVPAALRLLLGHLNFALAPQTNGPSKLFVYRTSVQDAIELVPRPKPAAVKSARGAIANELVVALKPGASTSIETLARRLGAKLTGRIDGMNAYRLQFDDAAAAQTARDALNQDSSVASVDHNFMFEQPDPMAPLSLSSSTTPALKLNVKNDSGRVVVGLIDTAVQPKAAGIDGFLLPGIAVAGQGDPSNTQPTHGTAMAETILHGVSQSDAANGGTTVRILPVDVYGSNQNTTTFDVAKGIYSAIQGGATLINLSLGSGGDSPFLHQQIQAASQQGVLFFGAAGNVPTTAPTYPAAYPEVISVTAGSRTGLAPYANRGDFVDVVAPGTSIVTFNNTDYVVMGTSASTADVTGLAAGLSDQSGKTPAQIRAEILNKLSIAPYRKP
jgi:hypothetical protein